MKAQLFGRAHAAIRTLTTWAAGSLSAAFVAYSCGALASDGSSYGVASQSNAGDYASTLHIGGGGDTDFTNVEFLNSGFVGIAKTAPSYTLDVGGATGTQHLVGRSGPPTVARGAGTGTTGTVVITGTDLAGAITVTTSAGGTGPTANSVIARVSFADEYRSAPFCVFSPANQSAAVGLTLAESIYVTATTATFALNAGTTALPRPSTYIWNYSCVQ